MKSKNINVPKKLRRAFAQARRANPKIDVEEWVSMRKAEIKNANKSSMEHLVNKLKGLNIVTNPERLTSLNKTGVCTKLHQRAVSYAKTLVNGNPFDELVSPEDYNKRELMLTKRTAWLQRHRFEVIGVSSSQAVAA